MTARADAARGGPPVEGLEVAVCKIPTDRPESDGTFAWDATTLVVVHVRAGGARGLGYTYSQAAAGRVVEDLLRGRVVGRDAFALPRLWLDMVRAVRNLGDDGLCMMAVSAVDAALWDLKARLLGLPLCALLGMARDAAEIYGSGGFTSYSDAELQEQLGGWAEEGIPRVKMKVGRDPARDPARVAAARRAVGDGVELFVDANGGYGRKQALAMAERFAESGATWFEEPVWHRDLDGLRLLRDRAPAGMDVTAGEYGFQLVYFEDMLRAGAVDVLQADATRCGVTGFLQVAALCQARMIPLSSHCAPALHLPLCLSVGLFREMEYFHDHARIEAMLFDGAPRVVDGRLVPDLTRPGLGLELKAADAARFAL